MKAMKNITGHKYKDNDKDNDKDKDTYKVPENPTYAIFLKSWWLTHSKHDDRYLTLAILFTPVTLVTMVTLVTLFWSRDKFYRAECITVLAFFPQSVATLFLPDCFSYEKVQATGFSGNAIRTRCFHAFISCAKIKWEVMGKLQSPLDTSTRKRKN